MFEAAYLDYLVEMFATIVLLTALCFAACLSARRTETIHTNSYVDFYGLEVWVWKLETETTLVLCALSTFPFTPRRSMAVWRMARSGI